MRAIKYAFFCSGANIGDVFLVVLSIFNVQAIIRQWTVVSVSSYQLVNFYYCASGSDGVLSRLHGEREKSQGEECFQDRRTFLLLYAGSADTVDGDRDGSTPSASSPLMPRPGVVSGS